MMKNAILEMSELQVGYGKKVLLDNISLSVEPGKIVTLIGPNGAGKSTILKTIVKQLNSLGGLIFLDNQKMNNLSGNEMARQLSMVMTERPKPELMTCREVVSTGRYPYVSGLGILSREDWAKVDEAMERLNASDISGKMFSQISDGQRQRIMLARALCQEPKVLVLDEPTMYLDVRYKQELLTVIRQIAAERNIAVIMSLHELDLAVKVSDILGVVDGKTVAMVDSPEEVLKAGIIHRLYGLVENSYNPLTGSLYLNKNDGEPKIFIIGGAGKGIPFYYKMHREGISFATGILFENDVEYEVALALASELISAKAFYPIDDLIIDQAKKAMDRCQGYICALEEFGPLNEANRQLLEYAKSRGLVEWQK